MDINTKSMKKQKGKKERLNFKGEKVALVMVQCNKLALLLFFFLLPPHSFCWYFNNNIYEKGVLWFKSRETNADKRRTNTKHKQQREFREWCSD